MDGGLATIADMKKENTLPRVQRIFLCSTTYVRDVEVEISNLRTEFMAKDKQIDNVNSQVKSLNASLATFQEKHTTFQGKLKGIEEEKSSSI
ncbi:hypothetical protein AHAS_Ahas05G0064300 [Arachis hypogaea]